MTGENKNQLLPLFLILLLVFLLRLPSLFEPYWYGDEGIYFAVTETLKRGGVLYRDVIDNKTPLIYYLFTFLKTQFWVRVFASGWVLVNTAFIYWLGRLFLGKRGAAVAAFFFGLLGSLPLLEGNVANGELFFVLLSTIGFWLILKSLFKKGKSSIKSRGLFLAGMLFGAAFLFKAPALTDFGAATLFIFLISASLKEFLPKIGGLGLGFLVTVVPLVSYFALKGCFSEFVAASFWNNLTYTTAWSEGALSSRGLLFLKFFLLAFFVLALFVFRKRIKPASTLVYLWVVFALLGATLSNRPYPHYLIQAVPALALLVGKFISRRRQALDFFLLGLMCLVATRFFDIGLVKLRYQSAYFRNFRDFVFREKPSRDYLTFFDPITPRNYRAAEFLREETAPDDRIFIWGDQALLYALSRRAAVGRYVTAHHINDIPDAREETVVALNREKPSYILVDKGTTFSFPELFQLLKRDYNKRIQFGLIVVYQSNEI